MSRAACNADGSGKPHAGAGGEAANLVVVADDCPGGDEGNPGGHRFDDAQRIGADVLRLPDSHEQLEGDDGESCRGYGGQHVRFQSRIPLASFPFDAQDGTKQGGGDQAHRDYVQAKDRSDPINVFNHGVGAQGWRFARLQNRPSENSRLRRRFP